MPTDRQPLLRPLSLGNAIRWLPTDAASAATDEAALRLPVFVRTEVMREIDDHVRDAGIAAFGVLRGNLYHCPRLDIDYVLVEAITAGVRNRTGADDDARRDALAALVAEVVSDGSIPAGWYRGTMTTIPTAADAALHAALFPERWSVAVFREGAGPMYRGALLRVHGDALHASSTSIPFVELLPGDATLSGGSFPTSVAWVSHRPEMPRFTPLPGARPDTATADASARQRRSGEVRASDSRTAPRRTGPFVPRDTTTPPHGSVAAIDASSPSGAAPTAPPAPPAPPTPAVPVTPIAPVIHAQGPVSPQPADPARAARAPAVRGNRFDGIDRIFEPADASAAALGPDDAVPQPSPWGRPPASHRAARFVAVATLVASALAATWFVDRRIGVVAPDDLDAATHVDATAADSETGAAPTDSAAHVSRFAIARVDESTRQLAGTVAALEMAVRTTRFAPQRAAACARADSARMHAQLELESVDVAQHYLARPLDPARRAQLDSLRTRTATADSILSRACR